MVGDIADEVELQSRRRQEGILFAAVGFMQKLNAGLGTFFAGQVLNFINFDRSNHTAEQAYTLAFVQGLEQMQVCMLVQLYDLSDQN